MSSPVLTPANNDFRGLIMGYSSLVARREHELLLCCARTHVAGRLRELAATNVDWEYLFLLARRHAVVPLLYLQLERHASDLVPPENLRKLKQHYVENSARNAVLKIGRA